MLFRLLRVRETTLTKSNSTKLQETLMFISEQKTNLIPLFLRDITLKRILQSDWSTTFWVITPEQEFRQIWGLRWKVKNEKNFRFALFIRKKMSIFF